MRLITTTQTTKEKSKEQVQIKEIFIMRNKMEKKSKVKKELRVVIRNHF